MWPDRSDAENRFNKTFMVLHLRTKVCSWSDNNYKVLQEIGAKSPNWETSMPNTFRTSKEIFN